MARSKSASERERTSDARSVGWGGLAKSIVNMVVFVLLVKEQVGRNLAESREESEEIVSGSRRKLLFYD
jgi:hypothetical protein